MWFSFVFLYNLFSYLKTYRNREITFRQPSGPPRAPQGTIILTNARGTTKNGSDFSENCRKSARGLSANQRVSSWEGGTVGALGLKNPTGPGVPSHSGSVVYIMGSVFCVAGPTHPYNGMGEDQGCFQLLCQMLLDKQGCLASKGAVIQNQAWYSSCCLCTSLLLLHGWSSTRVRDSQSNCPSQRRPRKPAAVFMKPCVWFKASRWGVNLSRAGDRGFASSQKRSPRLGS